MIVARKRYRYADLERQNNELQLTPAVQNKKDSKVKVAHKIGVILSILVMASICIYILIGYARLTELKYKVNVLQKEREQLEMSIENLKVDVESVQRIDLIEQKAQTDLGMKYPHKEQMVFLNIKQNNTKEGVPNIAEEVEIQDDNNLIACVREAVQKIYMLLD